MKKRSEAKREAIIEEAARAFRESGFDRTSMSDICARVGGSKATIYNYFASKEELFAEVVMRSTEASFQAAHHAITVSPADIGGSLRQFGERFLAFLYSPEVQATRHMAIAQSRHSAVGRLLYEHGVTRSHALVSGFLERAMEGGALKKGDPAVATLHLVSLLESELLDRFLYQLPGEVTAKEIEEATGRAVDVFMAAYGSAGGTKES
ncbi:TetR/AcrR family transcriptional regulator [Geomonas sp. Red32]|uniref:TetR/AcrR family transcriptional regulator n=1 Tax=Geomonas sp. Red32 TaxID=2912856 RepID=UPI00202CD46E|nr:TetR/AcrR family transcriptional regulator [Geomonas sp. Red32]MCM0082459.1 TetR/AcrR family transcriptional regulator [Geomonas sp. Red32]